MNHYKDITLKPNEEINLFLLRNKVYDKLHKALYDVKNKDIGVSFPNLTQEDKAEHSEVKDEENTKENTPTLGIITYKLGNIIRLHGTGENLEVLRETIDLSVLSDYCDASRIKIVPEQVKGYQNYSRKRQVKNNAKLKRLIKRRQIRGEQTINEENIKSYKANLYKQGLEYPFIELISVSTKQRYRIFIEPSKINRTPTEGVFNQFGLSPTATVPIF